MFNHFLESKFANNMKSDFKQKPVLCWLAVVALAFSGYAVIFGTNNVRRALHHQSTYTMEQYNANADRRMTVHIQQNRHQQQGTGYQNQEQQQAKFRQMHLEKVSQYWNKVGCKHGVTKIAYNPTTHHLNVHFNTIHPSKAQQEYAQHILTQINK